MNDLHQALDRVDWHAVALVAALVLGVLVGLCIYFAPTIIALARKHRQRAAIFWLNLLTGWTFIGWVAAFVWAFTRAEPAVVLAASSAPSAADELERFASLRDRGVISEAEFQAKKRTVLGV